MPFVKNWVDEIQSLTRPFWSHFDKIRDEIFEIYGTGKIASELTESLGLLFTNCLDADCLQQADLGSRCRYEHLASCVEVWRAGLVGFPVSFN